MPPEITFDDTKYKIRSRAITILGAPEVPTMIKFLVKKGIAKNEKQAVIIISIMIVLFIGVSIYLINKSVAVQPATIDPVLNTVN